MSPEGWVPALSSVLNQGRLCPLEDTWQCPDTLSLSQLGPLSSSGWNPGVIISPCLGEPPTADVSSTPTLWVKALSLSDAKSLLEIHAIRCGDPLLCPRFPAACPSDISSHPRKTPGPSLRVTGQCLGAGASFPQDALPGPPASSRSPWAWLGRLWAWLGHLWAWLRRPW